MVDLAFPLGLSSGRLHLMGAIIVNQDVNQIGPKKGDVTVQPSLGKMSVYKILNWQDRAASPIEATVAMFLEIGEAIATRWIQTARGVLLLQMVPGEDASGAIYIFDRRCDQWYMLSFEDCEDQFTAETFDRAFSEYDLFRFVEEPSLLAFRLEPFRA